MYHFKLIDPSFLPHRGCAVEFSLKKGAGLLVSGENGLGKTTLLHRLWNEFKGSKILVEQKALDVFYDWRVKDVRIGLSSHLKNPREVRRFSEVWETLGLPSRESRRLSELSGGENQLLKLAAGLGRSSEVYFLDEPSQYLDQERKQHLASLLAGLRKDAAASLIMVEHDWSWVGEEWSRLPLGLAGSTMTAASP